MQLFKLTAIGAFFCFLLISACQQDETTPVLEKTGVVKANQAYQDNFGTPPQGKAGQAFARVGYLPLKQNPEKLRPIPLFLFTEPDQMRQILERLISKDLLLHRESDLYSPFPDDLEISVTSTEGPSTTISLITQQSWSPTDLAAAGRALAQTALQFSQVDNVIILLNGAPLPQMPTQGYQREPQSLVKVELPRLVLMAGVWEDGAENLSELLIEFDRPIKVNKFKLYDNAGDVVDGDYFTSLFQMAVVIHPKDPARYQEATVLRAEWDVVDDLGRTNRGIDTLPMLRIDH